MADAYQVVRDFEAALCAYTGAMYAVTTNSCTMALTLAVAWHMWKDVPEAHSALLRTRTVTIPRRTYVSVPQAILHAGARPVVRDEDWRGAYRLAPLPVWDAARMFKSMMYADLFMSGGGQQLPFVCVSFHASKILGDTQGGAILHSDPEADAWLRRARFDGRTEGVAPIFDTIQWPAWHCYMSPDVAARLLLKLSVLPKHNDDLPNSDYPDLSQMEAFR